MSDATPTTRIWRSIEADKPICIEDLLDLVTGCKRRCIRMPKSLTAAMITKALVDSVENGNEEDDETHSPDSLYAVALIAAKLKKHGVDAEAVTEAMDSTYIHPEDTVMTMGCVVARLVVGDTANGIRMAIGLIGDVNSTYGDGQDTDRLRDVDGIIELIAEHAGKLDQTERDDLIGSTKTKDVSEDLGDRLERLVEALNRRRAPRQAA